MILEAITSLGVFSTLKNNMRLKTAELQEIQERKLSLLINHAYQNVPFYRRLFDGAGVNPKDIKNSDDLPKIPITTKFQFRDAKDEILARNIRIWVEHQTSGSTGIRLSLYFSMEDALHNRGTYERTRIENGFRALRDVVLYIGNPSIIPNGRKWYEHFGIRKKEGLSVFEPLEGQIQILRKAKPDALWGYPSAIKLIAAAIREKEIKGICPRLIFTASELLDPATRSFINSIFNADLIDAYVAEEGGCMAWECSEHAGYHMNMDTVLMEFLDQNGNKAGAGEKGRVVITNLHSFAMPVIRYELGDFAIPTYQECPCGRPGYLIKLIEGRCDDFIKLSNNKFISPRMVVPIVESVPGVSEFQLIQETVDEITVYITKKKEYGDAVAEGINAEFKKIFGDILSVDTKIVENIRREKSGKRRSVISRL